jgi:hypothetical protein
VVVEDIIELVAVVVGGHYRGGSRGGVGKYRSGSGGGGVLYRNGSGCCVTVTEVVAVVL